MFYIKTPGTMDGGDVMKCKGHFIVGKSARTNKEGIQQFREIVAGCGYEVTMVRLTSMLHLKTRVTCLGEKQVPISSDLKDNPVFEGFKKTQVPDESYAANSLEVNGKILISKGFSRTRQLIEPFRF
jgi:dimethylargininase